MRDVTYLDDALRVCNERLRRANFEKAQNIITELEAPHRAINPQLERLIHAT